MSAAKQPQTAEEALGCIADILATLPEEELTELTCTFELDEGRRLSLAPDFALIDLIMDLPEQERRDLLTETVDLMPPKERRRWIGVFECSRPGMMGYLMVHTDLLGMVQGLIEKLTKSIRSVRVILIRIEVMAYICTLQSISQALFMFGANTLTRTL